MDFHPYFNVFVLFCLISVRLSERNGDLGKGILEIYKVSLKKWVPACVTNWNQNSSPTMVCSLLGYNSVNSSRVTTRHTNKTLTPSQQSSKDPNVIARMYQRRQTNLIREFGSCSASENHPVIDLTCSNYGKYFSYINAGEMNDSDNHLYSMLYVLCLF